MENLKNDNQNGFIHIPILIIIVGGLIIASGGIYLGINQYKHYQVQKIIKQKAINIEQLKSQPTDTEKSVENPEIEKLTKELEGFRKQLALQAKQPKVNNGATEKIQPQNPPETTNINLVNTEIIKKIKPAVVLIETENGSGSGMIVSADGFILTNAHVVRGVSITKITFSTGQTLNGTIVGRDENIDLAILKVNTVGLPTVDLGNSDDIKQGDEVFALGYPFGLKGDVSFKEGTISRIFNEDDKTYFETSAEIHPGNSGGPLINKSGQVIGVNTKAIGESVQGIIIGETIKLAIPINVVKNLLPELKSGRNIVLEISPKIEINSDSQAVRTFYADLTKVVNEFSIGKQSFDQGVKNSINYPSMAIINLDNAISHFRYAYQIGLEIQVPEVPIRNLLSNIKQLYLEALNYQNQAAEVEKQVAIYVQNRQFNAASNLLYETERLTKQAQNIVTQIDQIIQENSNALNSYF